MSRQMQTPAASDTRPLAPVGPGFVALYMAAQVGAYVAFIPLLTLLLPLKAEMIDPINRAQLLGQVALWGALTAGVASVVAGVIGDRTRHWAGGRSLWMTLGLVSTIASYGLIHGAASPQALVVAIVALQISLNFMLNPLAATLAERVPGHQRGRVAAFTGLAFPLSSLFGALVIGVLLTTEVARFTAVAIVTVVMVAPFIVAGFGLPRLDRPARRSAPSLAALVDRDFVIAFASRLMIQTAVAMNVLYLLFFLDQETRIGQAMPDVRPEVVLGALLAIATVLSVFAGLASGRLSDRIGRRRILVFWGGVLLALGAVMMALIPEWPGPVFAQACLGLGVGLYGITEAALVAEVLPDPAAAGRDMGVMNVAMTGAQMLAPAIGLLALEGNGGGLRDVYLIGAALAFVGAVGVLAIRRVA